MNLYHRIMTKHRKEFAREIQGGNFEMSELGVYLPKQQVLFKGTYVEFINGEPAGMTDNLIPNEGRDKILDVFFGADSKIATLYMALYETAINPTTAWTAANFASTAGENTSTSEGYSESTRPEWVDAPASGQVISNLASRAAFTIVCTSDITIEGFAMLSDNTRGGTSGVLVSATRRATPRTLSNGDNYELGYQITASG